MPRPVHELDGGHATTAVAGSVQSICHQPHSAAMGRLLPAFAILEHVGRRSGKPYRTPLNVFSADVDGRAGVAILLTYGPNRDWLKNITAAGGGRMRRYGKTFGVANPRRLTKAEAAPYVSSRWRPVFARLPFDEAVLLTKAD